MTCFANGSATELYITPLVAGAIPTDAEWTPIRFVSEGLTRETTQIDSSEINPTRQRVVSRQGTYNVTGEVAVEASYGTFDTLMEAALQGTWAAKATLTSSAISAAESDDSYNGTGFTALGLSPGDKVLVSGFTDPANNGTKTVVTATGTKIVVAEALSDEAVGDSVTIRTASDSLKVSDTRREFAVLERHTDKSLDYVYSGIEVAQFNVSITLNAIAGLTFNLVGKESEEYTVPVGHTFLAPTTSQVMVTTQGALSENGNAIAYATELALSVDNGMEANFSVFQREAFCLSNGVLVATGTLNAYLVDGDLYGKFLTEALTDLSFTIQDEITAANAYTFNLPSVRITQADKSVSGPGAIIPSYTYSAGYDGTALTTLEIIRKPA